jgi:hypothetical protein
MWRHNNFRVTGWCAGRFVVERAFDCIQARRLRARDSWRTHRPVSRSSRPKAIGTVLGPVTPIIDGQGAAPVRRRLGMCWAITVRAWVSSSLARWEPQQPARPPSGPTVHHETVARPGHRSPRSAQHRSAEPRRRGPTAPRRRAARLQLQRHPPPRRDRSPAMGALRHVAAAAAAPAGSPRSARHRSSTVIKHYAATGRT